MRSVERAVEFEILRTWCIAKSYLSGMDFEVYFVLRKDDKAEKGQISRQCAKLYIDLLLERSVKFITCSGGVIGWSTTDWSSIRWYCMFRDRECVKTSYFSC